MNDDLRVVEREDQRGVHPRAIERHSLRSCRFDVRAQEVGRAADAQVMGCARSRFGSARPERQTRVNRSQSMRLTTAPPSRWSVLARPVAPWGHRSALRGRAARPDPGWNEQEADRSMTIPVAITPASDPFVTVAPICSGASSASARRARARTAPTIDRRVRRPRAAEIRNTTPTASKEAAGGGVRAARSMTFS